MSDFDDLLSFGGFAGFEIGARNTRALDAQAGHVGPLARTRSGRILPSGVDSSHDNRVPAQQFRLEAEELHP